MNGVVIVAAGTGSRMNMGINKQFIKLEGKEIIAYTIEKFYNNSNIEDIVVVVKEDESEFFKKEILDKYNFKNVKIAYGGKERQDSVYNGLKLLDEKCDVVLIHDGARPFVSDKIIDKSIEEAKEHKAIVVGVPVKDTIKVIDNDKNIVDTPNRSVLWAVQTPQTFDYNILIDAYKDAFKNKFYGTDDAMLVERIGYKVKMLEGSGYDVHKLVEGRKLIIGGVNVPHEKGLLGHSDADVLIHAVMDSILGALALGDIGKHFPDTDEKYKGADSMKLLEFVYNLINEKGYGIGNIDCTIIAQSPKMAPHIQNMRENIAKALNTSIENINVKATTEEGLGFTGAKEGIAAQSICLLVKVDK